MNIRISRVTQTVTDEVERQHGDHHEDSGTEQPRRLCDSLDVLRLVMGLVLFPIIAVFLGVSSMILFIGYDVMLPLVLYFVISSILESRPPTFSKIDISESPEVPREGKFRYGKKEIPALPVALIVGALIIGFGIFLYVDEINNSENPEGLIAAMVVQPGNSSGVRALLHTDILPENGSKRKDEEHRNRICRSAVPPGQPDIQRDSYRIVHGEVLFDPLNQHNPDPKLAELETRLTQESNQLGIGPMGFGGQTTVVDTKIKGMHRLPASFFVTVSYMCWAHRRRHMFVSGDEVRYE